MERLQTRNFRNFKVINSKGFLAEKIHWRGYKCVTSVGQKRKKNSWHQISFWEKSLERLLMSNFLNSKYDELLQGTPCVDISSLLEE